MAAASVLTRRVFVAVVFGPVLLALVWVGGLALLAVLCLIVGVGTWEFCRMQEQKGLQPWTRFGVAASLAWCICTHLLGQAFFHYVLAGIILLALVLALGKERPQIADAAATLMGIFYVGFLGSFVLLLRNSLALGMSEDGAAKAACLILLGIWASDTAAYFAGRRFGRRHPFPNLSPGKTVAGCVGALLGAWVVVVWGVQATGLLSVPAGIGLGLLVGVGAPVGDLIESMVKRDAGVKDASGIIPGHGGVLDRFDSFLFVYPLAYLYLSFLKWT